MVISSLVSSRPFAVSTIVIIVSDFIATADVPSSDTVKSISKIFSFVGDDGDSLRIEPSKYLTSGLYSFSGSITIISFQPLRT